MKIGDTFYSKRFIITIVREEENGMFGIDFDARDGSEKNYNIVSPQVLEAMISQREWVTGEDPWKN